MHVLLLKKKIKELIANNNNTLSTESKSELNLNVCLQVDIADSNTKSS